MRIQDPGLIMLPRLREYLLDIAETNNIPYQYFVSKAVQMQVLLIHKRRNPKYSDWRSGTLYPYASNDVQYSRF